MTRKELQEKLTVVYNESTLGDLIAINTVIKDYELIKGSTLSEWVNRLIRIRNTESVEEQRELVIDLESSILSTYR